VVPSADSVLELHGRTIMATALEKARKDVLGCKYKSAIKNLSKVQEEVEDGHPEYASQLLELATDLQGQSIGRIREDADRLAQFARGFLDAAKVEA
jgi:hypothetical protein